MSNLDQKVSAAELAIMDDIVIFAGKEGIDRITDIVRNAIDEPDLQAFAVLKVVKDVYLSYLAALMETKIIDAEEVKYIHDRAGQELADFIKGRVGNA